MKKAKLVLHHDDPPCYERLNSDGSCPVCKLHPDMQSTALHYYCPRCDLPLKDRRCPACGRIYMT